MATKTKKENVATASADYPRRWVFDSRDQGKADWIDGPNADGVFVRFEQAPAAEYGVKPILILSIDGVERSIWILHDALYGRIRDELSRRSMPKLVPGERVVIEKLEGKTESKNNRSYVNYRVLFPDAPAPDEAAMFGLAPTATDKDDAEPTGSAQSDDDIPFEPV